MNLTQLRYFTAVARSKSLSSAAAELRIAQPAITRQLKLLEGELDAVLLVRHHRGVELTDAGRLLLERAEFQIESFDRIRNEFRELSFAPSGRVRIGCPPGLTRQLLKRPVSRFIKRYPNVAVEVKESISEQLARAVLTDGVDFAIASTLAQVPHVSKQVLFKDPIWLFGPRGVKLPRRISPRYLAGLPLLLARRNNATRELVERHIAEAGLRLNVMVETDSTALIEDLVRAGSGYVAAPYSSLHDRLQANRMTGAPIERLAIERSLLWRKDRALSRAVRELLSLLEPEIAALGRRAAAGIDQP